MTIAMMPAHKETVKRHPGKFVVGLVLHTGVILALLSAGLLTAWPPAGHWLTVTVRPLFALALLAGAFVLAVRESGEIWTAKDIARRLKDGVQSAMNNIKSGDALKPAE